MQYVDGMFFPPTSPLVFLQFVFLSVYILTILSGIPQFHIPSITYSYLHSFHSHDLIPHHFSSSQKPSNTSKKKINIAWILLR